MNEVDVHTVFTQNAQTPAIPPTLGGISETMFKTLTEMHKPTLKIQKPNPEPINAYDVVQAIEFSDAKILGEIEEDIHGKLLKGYFNYEGILGSHIETYDKWITATLGSQMSGTKFTIPQGTVTVVNPMLYPPRISTSDSNFEILTPQMCRDMGYTYSSELYVDLILNEGTLQEEKLVQIFIGKVPIMLGSVLCHLRGKTDRELIELGECPKDPLGYFIIKGSENVIMIQEKLRVNRIFLYNSSSKEDIVCKMTCNTCQGSSNVTIVQGKKSKVLEVHLSFMGRSDAQVGKIGNTVSVFQIYRMLGVTDPNEMLKMVCTFTKKEYIKKIWVQLQPTFVELGQIGDDIEYISKKKGLGDISYETKQSDIMRDLKNQLFTHIPSENITRKLQMLSIMIARFSEYLIGVRELDDRDNWGNKRLESAGRSLEQLFGNIWREVVNRTQDTINVKNLQGLHSVRREIDPSFITDNFVSSFNANSWGVQGSYMAKENIVEHLKRDAIAAVYSHLTKINTPTQRKAKQMKIRLIPMSQVGYVCPAETPEGQQCGLVKNSSITLYISIERDEDLVSELITPYIVQEPSTQTTSPVILNGRFIGWCNGKELKALCVKMKRQLTIYKDTAIVLDHDGYLYIYTDAARPTRPLLVVDVDNELVIKKKDMWDADMRTLLENGCVEYIDAFEQEYIQLAQSIYHMDDRKKELEMVRNNLAEAEKKFQTLASENNRHNLEQAKIALDELLSVPFYTHCELDPSAILGLAASLIPLSNHNQAPRNTYQCGMAKQALGIYHSQHYNRYDTTSKCLSYPSRPAFETQMYDIMGMGDLPAGSMVVVAICTYTGCNQEDSLIMNEASIARGLFRQEIYKSFKSVQKRTRATVEEFCRPEIRKGQSESRFASINEKGIPTVGSFVREGDCIIGKIRKNLTTGKIENASTYVGVSMEGVIDRVKVSSTPEGMTMVKVKIRQIRCPIMGDKFASRHAQKGTIGKILPPEEMPFTANGVIPDIVINPHCIPSRMTMAKVIEIVVSKIAAFTGERYNATPYRRFDIKEFKERLTEFGYNSSGKEKMYSGFTGKPLEAEIYIGPCYYQVLRHHVADKIQMRARGAINQLSHQPVGGRAIKGGQRFGEMERDGIISHGASSFLRERLSLVSDAYQQVFCSVCGDIAIANMTSDKFVCRKCEDGAKFGSAIIPYAYKYMTHILAGASFNLQCVMSEVSPTTEILN